MKFSKGAFDPISLSIIALCLAVGGYYYFGSDAIDSPAEQAVESVLKKEGIDIDFSKDKKAKQSAKK